MSSGYANNGGQGYGTYEAAEEEVMDEWAWEDEVVDAAVRKIHQAKSSNTGGVAVVKSGGCASPEGCRCVNLNDDPQKVFKLVLEAMRHINGGATLVEIHCYMRKHHRMPDDEHKLIQIMKNAINSGICSGCLRRGYYDGKGRCPATC
uniref:Uncharacterized protein n=1 Tax=Strigamia maritima TaxID=126957 RepID=T1JI36_STRMM